MSQDELSLLLTDHAGRHRVRGASLAVLRDGEVAKAHFGTSDVATDDPVTGETRFVVGSITKPLVATVVAGLAAEGLLSLDDPLSERVGELTGSGWATRATVRDLMANRSRLPLRFEWEFQLDDDGEDALARCASLVSAAEAAAPVWSYSNVGWSLLGRLIETATGLSWEEAMRARLLVPAGMSQTTFALFPATEPRARGHEVSVAGIEPTDPWIPRVYCSAGTSLLSTASDLAAFAGWFMSDLLTALCWKPTLRSPSTAGSTPGAWDGAASTGTVERSGVGTAWRQHSGRCFASYPIEARQWP